MKGKQKRNMRTYRIADGPYEAAKKRADKTDTPLASRVENFIFEYAGIERSSYFAAMGDVLIKSSKKKKK